MKSQHQVNYEVPPIIPHVEETTVTINEEQWTIEFYSEYKDVVLGAMEEVVSKLSHHCLAEFSSHRTQVSLSGAPLLAGIFPAEKNISFYSPRLGRELFLIEHIQQNKSRDPLKSLVETNEYKKFKIYAEKVAGLTAHEFPSVHQLTTQKYKLPQMLGNKEFKDIEDKMSAKIEELVPLMEEYKPTLFEKVSDFGLDLTARFALMRIHLLKFVAILPSLDHDKEGTEVKRIFLETFRRLTIDSTKAKLLKLKGQEAPLPPMIYYALKVVLFIGKYIPAKILGELIRSSVRAMATRFIAGENIESVQDSFKSLFSTRRDVTLDQLGELVVSEKEADNYCSEVINLINGLGQHIKKGDKNKAGIYRSHVSIKVSALCSDFKPDAFDYTYKLVAPRLKQILIKAKEKEVFIHVDAEHYHYRDCVLEIYAKVLLDTPELHDFQQTAIVVQAYLRDGYQHLMDVLDLARKRNLLMPIRLVKGAYWDAETIEADAHSFDAPEFLNKEETDLNFRQMIHEIFKHGEYLQLCIASHNFQDHCFAETLREEKFPNAPVIEHQCLHMTYEALSVALAKMGWATRNYVPVGSLLVGMAYLVRRIMENSSQVGVLTIMRSHKKAARIDDPMTVHEDNIKNWSLQFDKTINKMTSDFFNITPIRTYLKEEKNIVASAYDKFKESMLGVHYSNDFLNEDDIKSNHADRVHKVFSSSDPDLLVGTICFAGKEDVDRAMDVVEKGYESGSWSRQFWLSRCSVLLKAADLMLARRNDLAALISYEAGKAIAESYADVDEAIDFLNYYAREERKVTAYSDQMVGRGPIVAITPWNFPMAIPTGMISGPLVSGNTVVLKSAEQTPLIAQMVVNIMHEAGVPKDALVHLPGQGEDIGQALVDHPKAAGYVFTGSRPVGQMISHKASKRFYHNKLWNLKFPVKAITELGGKNAIIVTANAELDETVAGILYSSFAHAGQKCSAASRVIVDASIKERLIERLEEAVKDLEVSEAFKFSCTVNPVISEEDKLRLQKQVKEAGEEARAQGGRVIVDRSQEELPGYCVGPSVFEVPKHVGMNQDSYACKELFGPVVHIIPYEGLDDALDIFHATDYALTGGIFSQSQDDIDYLSQFMECGSLYINRTITGARVGIEPFGGFKMSGTGPKAGGKVYIPAFHIHKHAVDETKVSEHYGADYTIELAGRSGLGPQMRVERMVAGLDQFIDRFEQFFQGIRGSDNKLVMKFRKWVDRNALTYMTKQHKNTQIPGQMSYSDFTISGEHAVAVVGSEIPHVTTFLQVSAAILMGTGVTVLCCNKKSYEWWSALFNYYQLAGISKENFSVYYPTEEALDKELSNPMINYFIVDGHQEFIEKVTPLIYSEEYTEKRVRQLFTPYDTFNPYDFKRLCGIYVWVRAFAINTMRHGAPLEIDLDVEL